MAQQLLLAVTIARTVMMFFLSAPAACASAAPSSYCCGWCPRRSSASLLPPDGAGILSSAACSYGPANLTPELADEGFHTAAVSAGFFRDGRACGACYQLRCRGRTACAEDGVKVVIVADAPDTNITGRDGGGRFLLTRDAFAAMINTPNHGAMAAPQHGDDRLASFDTVDVDFRRIPCVYRDRNLSVKVEETSVRSRGRLALRFLFQGGQTDIAAIEVAQAVNDDAAPSPASMWRYMTQREGSPAVWTTSPAPAGPFRLRVVVTAGSGGKWLRSDGAVLPAEWVPGGVYDTGLRVADVAASTCGGASCNAGAGEDEDGDEELR